GWSRRTSALAIVDLPQPDSPTMASVPPRGTVKETSSTARKTSLPVLYSTTRFDTVSRLSAMGRLLQAVAGRRSRGRALVRALGRARLGRRVVRRGLGEDRR